MNDPIIQIDNLKVIYNKGKSNEVRALDGINLKIYPQEYVIFYGPSGCGKSTVLYSISGLQASTEGETIVLGKKLSTMKKKEMVELHQVGVGMIFQAFYLIPSLSVIDNICLPKVFQGESKQKRREEGIKLLQRFSIAEQSNKFPGQLSGGQKQRVSIARALVNNPSIILADEPVGNLDSESADNVLQILKELNEVDKKTIILVTHNAEHLHFADRVIYMKDGKIIREEVRKEKRPIGVIKEDEQPKPDLEALTEELRILMRTFRNLTTTQIGALLVPFKANQLMSHILSDLTQEQLDAAGGFLKEFLYRNIGLDAFRRSLDLSYEKGGAGWNSQRTRTFSDRIASILEQSRIILEEKEEKALYSVTEYLVQFFKLNLDHEVRLRFNSFIKIRLQNKIDRKELRRKLDDPWKRGGIGLHRSRADKISREVEIIMLVKYSQ